jgi:hypothetical protein
MPDSNAPTGLHVPLDPAQYPSTGVWGPAAPAPGPSQGPTVAAPAASTPGPDAPDRGTNTESTEPMCEPLARLPQLPPVPGYRVQRFVGRGGMGVVYQAVHLATGRTVALKVANPSGAHDRVSRERFAREVHALAALKHPNIVPVYDAGDWHGFPYCAMEYVPGGTLAGHLERVRGDLRAAVRLVAKVARAVAALHAAGVLHRDLKPLNILLGTDDEPMVADFGLARWADEDSDLTNTGLPVGTRVYMAPEQTFGRREDYTPACDVWALGVILYEVLTGQRPFFEDGVTDVYHRIRHEDPPPVATSAPSAPAELEAVARKCLEKRPDDRYASAAAVAEDLERWLAGEPLSVPPAPAAAIPATLLSGPAREPARRLPRLLAGLGVLLLAVAMAGLSGAFRERAPQRTLAQRVAAGEKAGLSGAFRERAPQRTLAQRVAAGEKVNLTDDTGKPTVSPTPTQGHDLFGKDSDGHHAFSTTGTGIVSLADEPWELPIRIEADVAVPYEDSAQPLGGVYVGRKAWAGLDFKHESLVWFGMSPQLDNKEADFRRLIGQSALYWWERDQPGPHISIKAKSAPWDRDGKSEKWRFASVVIKVYDKQILGWVDGMELPPVGERRVTDDLKRRVTDDLNREADRRRFPPDTFAAPPFGTGIGIFCQKTDCVVRNLTVSKLNP